MKKYLFLPFKICWFIVKWIFIIIISMLAGLSNTSINLNRSNNEISQQEKEQKDYWNRTGRYTGNNEKRWYED